MNSKTAITILQEMMMKKGELPTYEFINQTGPQHMATFEYRCTAGGVTATATARSKKEAKQEVARRVLAILTSNAASPGPTSPGPALPSQESASGSGERTEGEGDGKSGDGTGVRSHVMLLKELCEEFRLGSVVYDLVGDTGPPHNRRFTVTVTLGRHERTATANTKKAARQLAAEQLYTYLRENLASATKDFVEEDALSRALDKVMSRFVEMKEAQPWRPDLGQRVADYHLGLLTHISKAQRQAAELVLETDNQGEDPIAQLEVLAASLGLTVQMDSMQGEAGPISVVSLTPTSPALALAGLTPHAAAAAALRYVRRALRQSRPLRPLQALQPHNATLRSRLDTAAI